ncbi:hypothetical protein A3Q56_07790 [Intoshia linei]|uniref:Exoribonuclease phosphorolytic domain-containing protein n=1 Tax=Intoshia linei TaxID=1819745 RepID=A0A177ASJ2_9BILA|nr:hypothetical protein A3Q56_07790 [Intoshia linei]
MSLTSSTFLLSECEKLAVLNSLKKTVVISELMYKCHMFIKRVDGRKHFDLRNVIIDFADEDGTCTISLGSTIVMSRINRVLTEPSVYRKSEGLVRIHPDFSSSCMNEMENSGNAHVYLQNVLNSTFISSNCIDVESLCLVVGKRVWQLDIEIVVLNYDGNVVDASVLAVLTSLITYKLPQFSIDGDYVVIYPKEEKAYVPLNMYYYPFSFTFTLFNLDNVLYDSLYVEELVSRGQITIVINNQRQLCGLFSLSPFSQKKMIQKCVEMTLKEIEPLYNLFINEIRKKYNIKLLVLCEYLKTSNNDQNFENIEKTTEEKHTLNQFQDVDEELIEEQKNKINIKVTLPNMYNWTVTKCLLEQCKGVFWTYTGAGNVGLNLAELMIDKEIEYKKIGIFKNSSGDCYFPNQFLTNVKPVRYNRSCCDVFYNKKRETLLIVQRTIVFPDKEVEYMGLIYGFLDENSVTCPITIITGVSSKKVENFVPNHGDYFYINATEFDNIDARFIKHGFKKFPPQEYGMEQTMAIFDTCDISELTCIYMDSHYPHNKIHYVVAYSYPEACDKKTSETIYDKIKNLYN